VRSKQSAQQNFPALRGHESNLFAGLALVAVALCLPLGGQLWFVWFASDTVQLNCKVYRIQMAQESDFQRVDYVPVRNFVSSLATVDTGK
jgi:hypothetical protein